MNRHTALVCLVLIAILVLAACAPTHYDEAMEATVIAKVMATIAYQQTAAVPPTPTPAPTAADTPTPPSTPIPPATPTPPPEITDQEYAVYAAVIELNPVNFDLEPWFAVRQQTITGISRLDFGLDRDPSPALPADLEASYRSRCATSYPMVKKLDIALEYEIMPESDWKYIFQGQGSQWTKLQERYPDASGAVILSRVGFTEDGSQALVEMGVRCGDLCGMGGLYWLEKIGDSWAIKDTLVMWES